MNPLPLHSVHQTRHAQFGELHQHEIVAHYGDPDHESTTLRKTAGVLDLSFRGRLRLSGPDSRRFLNGQVTNNVKDLAVGQGCYAALLTPKGKLESDLNLYCLADGFLLDLEPGLTPRVSQRFDKYIIADDVQLTDLAASQALISVQGPTAEAVIRQLDPGASLPAQPMESMPLRTLAPAMGLMVNQPRTGSAGFDLFVPAAAAGDLLARLAQASADLGGGLCGWQALEAARIEAGIPRFGIDMDETNLAPEAGIETRAICYTKGCYVGQEVIARIHAYGQVARTLRGLWLTSPLERLPARGTKLFRNHQEVGYITSAVASPTWQTPLALGYVRREVNHAGLELTFPTPGAEGRAVIVELPFRQPVPPRDFS